MLTTSKKKTQLNQYYYLCNIQSLFENNKEQANIPKYIIHKLKVKVLLWSTSF